MAKIKLGTMVVGIRGTIDGLVFSENAGGPYAKRWVRGRQKRSTILTERRGVWSEFPQAWRNLTAAERTGWNSYAAAPAQQLTDSLGQTYFASGFNWFVRINTNLALVGRGLRSAAPTNPTPAAPNLTTLTVTAPGTSGNSVTFPASEFNGFDGVWVMQLGIGAGTAVPADRSFLTVDTRQNYTTESSEDLGDLQPFFGTLVANRRAWIRGFKQDPQGRRSAPTQLQTLIV